MPPTFNDQTINVVPGRMTGERFFKPADAERIKIKLQKRQSASIIESEIQSNWHFW
jgi:hypothetical protein